jgi:hypothetical protein
MFLKKLKVNYPIIQLSYSWVLITRGWECLLGWVLWMGVRVEVWIDMTYACVEIPQGISLICTIDLY